MAEERGEAMRGWDPGALSSRERYHLLTSLVVPRPIAWVSSRGATGGRNLAPFSYFMAVAHSPFTVAVSIGTRGGVPKDTLRNIRETGVFCINVVSERHLEAMNLSAGEYGPEIDEFERAGLRAADAEAVDAPCVEGCPAILECRLVQEVALHGDANVLVIAEVVRVRVAEGLPLEEGSLRVVPEVLRPVARLGGEAYGLPGRVVRIARPVIE